MIQYISSYVLLLVKYGLMSKWLHSVLTDIIQCSNYFFFFAPFYAPVLAKKLIDKKLEMIQQRVDNKQDVEGEYLTYLLSNTQMSTKDVYGSVTELLLAGVDTVNGIPILVIKNHM